MIRLFKYLYIKLIRTNDTPHKIALGFAIGVFYGLLPGMGPVAALVSAVFFKANKAASLLGAIFVNTWTLFILTPLAVKTGAIIFGIDWHRLNAQISAIFKNFSLKNLFVNSTIYKILLPALAGYLLIALAVSLIGYFSSLIIINLYKKAKK